MTTQLPLPLTYATALGARDFFVSHCNVQAVEWLNLFPAWNHHATLLLGPEGAGKSHLAGAWQARHAGLVWDAPIEPADEVPLFHHFNATREAGQGLLIVQRDVPKVQLPDLASRLSSVPIVRIEAPDDAALAAVLIKAARDCGLSLPPEVVDYILPRIERHFAAAHRLVQALDRLSLAKRRAVSVPLAAAALRTDAALPTHHFIEPL